MNVETTTINYSTNIILIRSDMTGQVEGIYAIIEERLQYIYTCTQVVSRALHLLPSHFPGFQ
jgi:hypothetical protein